MQFVDVRQRTDAWHDWRRQGVTATDMVVVLGYSPWKTPYRLWAEKTGLLEELDLPPARDLSTNPLVRRGTEFEDLIVGHVAAQNGDVILPACGEHTGWPTLRASFDGLDSEGEPVEAKCPHPTTFSDLKAHGPRAGAFMPYYYQLQVQLVVSGKPKGRLVFADVDDASETVKDVVRFNIKRDDALAIRIVEEAKAFWQRVVDLDPPEPDPAFDVFAPRGEAREAWEKAAQRYRQIERHRRRFKALTKRLNDEADAIEASLVEAMGDFAQGHGCGLTVTRYLQRGAIDYAAAAQQIWPDLDTALFEPYRRKTSARLRVTVSDAPEPSTASAEAPAGQGG